MNTYEDAPLTPRELLLRRNAAAFHAVQAALAALHLAAPEGSYYPSVVSGQPLSRLRALAKHKVRIEDLESIAQDLLRISDAIVEDARR